MKGITILQGYHLQFDTTIMDQCLINKRETLYSATTKKICLHILTINHIDEGGINSHKSDKTPVSLSFSLSEDLHIYIFMRY